MNENFRYSTSHKTFRNIDVKILIQFTILFVTSLFIGVFLPRFLDENFLISQSRNISFHFEIPIYYGMDKKFECLNAILKYSFIDILCIFVIFIFSFSSSHFIISGIVLIYLGLRNGCIAYLVYITPKLMTDNSPQIAELFIFFIAKVMIVFLIIRYIMYSLLFSINFFKENFKDTSKLAETLKFVCSSLLYIFTILVLHAIYVFLIKAI